MKYNSDLIIVTLNEFLEKLAKGGINKPDEQIAIFCTVIASITIKANIDKYSVMLMLATEMEQEIK